MGEGIAEGLTKEAIEGILDRENRGDNRVNDGEVNGGSG